MHEPEVRQAARPGASSMRRISRRRLFDPESYGTGAEADYWLRVHRRAMACRFEVTLGGEDAAHVAAARQALDEVDGIEARLTVFRETSAIVHVNRHAAERPVAVDRDLFDLLSLCQALHRTTAGAFDVTSTPLSRTWGFLRREGRLPSPSELTASRACVGMERVQLDATTGTVRFDCAGMEINLGAIGKGWALDSVARGLRRRAAGHALVSAGRSSVLAVGSGARSWPVDLTTPRLGKPLARVHLRAGALSTSGAGEQFFEVDGRRYGHVLDPRTGWPADSGVVSVSVLTADAAVADALSTAFLVGGIELARGYCAATSDVMAVMTLDDEMRRPHVLGRFPGADVEAG